MYCRHCGARIEETQSFCSACGKPTEAAGPAAAMPERNRVARHIQVVAILWLAWSILHLARGAGMLVFGHFGLPFIPFHAMPFGFRAWLFPLVTVLGIASLSYAVAGIIAAWGLFQRLQWARILALIVAFLALVQVPFGTALGIYTLWALLPTQSAEEYARMCPPA